MKKIFLLCLFSFTIFIQLKATDWFPIGAKWTWDYNLCCNGDIYTDKWEVIKDTTINSNFYKIILQKDLNSNIEKRIILKEQNKIVYRLLNNQLLPICDFTKNVNDTCVFIAPNYSNKLDTFRYVIDSLKPLPQNLSLSTQYVRLISVNNLGLAYFTTQIIERTIFYGFENAVKFTAIETPTAIKLRCYTDNILQIRNLSIDCDSLLSSFKEKLNKDLQIKIFPNPTSSQIQLEFTSSKNYNHASFSILDMQGKTLIQNEIKNYQRNLIVDVLNIPNGMYFMKIIIDNEFNTTKIIINH